VYREYLDPEFRELFDLQNQARMAALALAGERLEMRQESQQWASDKAHGLAGAWDHERRNAVLDADGVVAEVLFVDGLTEENSPPFGGDLGLMPTGVVPDAARILDGCRNSLPRNRFAVTASPSLRLFGVSMLLWRRLSGRRITAYAES
jgi:hypothetical protein